MTPGVTYPTLALLSERANEKGLTVGLTVGSSLHEANGAEYRNLDRIVLRPTDKPKAAPVYSMPVNWATVECASQELLRRLG